MGIEHYNKAVSIVDNSAFYLRGYLAWGKYDNYYLQITSKSVVLNHCFDGRMRLPCTLCAAFSSLSI